MAQPCEQVALYVHLFLCGGGLQAQQGDGVVALSRYAGYRTFVGVDVIVAYHAYPEVAIAAQCFLYQGVEAHDGVGLGCEYLTVSCHDVEAVVSYGVRLHVIVNVVALLVGYDNVVGGYLLLVVQQVAYLLAAHCAQA